MSKYERMAAALDVLAKAECPFDVTESVLIAQHYPDCIDAASVLRGYPYWQVDNAQTLLERQQRLTAEAGQR
jgi:hypothetical protein